MSPASSDFSAPLQGLVKPSYDQGGMSLSRARKRAEKRRRIAALARLVLAVAEGRRLADAELRDVLLTRTDVVEAWHLRLDLERAGLVVPTVTDGRQLDLPLAANQDGRAAP